MLNPRNRQFVYKLCSRISSGKSNPIARSGYTLLEILLALALTVLIVYGIGLALDLHVRILKRERDRVSGALLSRSVMQMIATDLRSGVQYKPMDMSELQTLLAGTDLTALLGDPSLAAAAADLGLSGGTGGSGGSGAGGGAGTGGTGGTGGGGTGTGTDTGEETESSEGPRPGVYGSDTVLQVDISRMPRRDQLNSFSSVNAANLAADMRTVVYYIGAGRSQTAFDQSSTAQPSVGLCRAEVSSAAARSMGAAGQSLLQDSGVLLATEVTSIQFRYFDGEAWQTSWDSDEMGYLPIAVEIVLTFIPGYDGTEPLPTTSSNSSNQPQQETHRRVIHLPLAEVVEDDDGASGAGSSGSGSNSGNQQNQGGTSQ